MVVEFREYGTGRSVIYSNVLKISKGLTAWYLLLDDSHVKLPCSKFTFLSCTIC